MAKIIKIIKIINRKNLLIILIILIISYRKFINLRRGRGACQQAFHRFSGLSGAHAHIEYRICLNLFEGKFWTWPLHTAAMLHLPQLHIQETRLTDSFD